MTSTTSPAPADALAAVVNGNIRAEIARQGYPIAALSRELGWSEASVRRRLRGGIEWTLSDIERVALVLAVDPKQLLA